jgi:hypothetical protein
MMNFATASADDLFDYAAHWEDPLHGVASEALTWLFVEAFPLEATSTPAAEWRRWFKEENEMADVPDHWAGMLDVVGTDRCDPLVIGLVAQPDGADVNLWDGSHRTGAACTVGLNCLPAVLGIPADLTWAQVPPALKNSIPVHDALVSVMGLEPMAVVAPSAESDIRQARRARP